MFILLSLLGICNHIWIQGHLQEHVVKFYPIVQGFELIEIWLGWFSVGELNGSTVMVIGSQILCIDFITRLHFLIIKY